MNYKPENIKQIIVTKPLKLDCGQTIKNFPIAYETYGELNKEKNNAVLIFHALTGDQFVTGTNPVTSRDGWWKTAVGPGKAVDTEKYFETLMYSFTAFGLGPNADSFEDNFILANFCLNKLNPAAYFSALRVLAFGNFIIYSSLI